MDSVPPETDTPSSEPGRRHLPPRPKKASLFMAAPVAFAAFLMFSLVSLVTMVWIGNSAKGERLKIVFQTACPQEAGPIIEARGNAIGLGDMQVQMSKSSVTVLATMPGLTDDRTAMPELLAMPGTVTFRSGEEILATEKDITEAVLKLDEGGNPITELALTVSAGKALEEATTADPEGTLTILFNGEPIVPRPNTPPVLENKIRLMTGTGKPAARMRLATDRSILLSKGAIPCPINVGEVTDVTAGSDESKEPVPQ